MNMLSNKILYRKITNKFYGLHNRVFQVFCVREPYNRRLLLVYMLNDTTCQQWYTCIWLSGVVMNLMTAAIVILGNYYIYAGENTKQAGQTRSINNV